MKRNKEQKETKGVKKWVIRKREKYSEDKRQEKLKKGNTVKKPKGLIRKEKEDMRAKLP